MCTIQIYQNDHFAKTGSGQTDNIHVEKGEKKRRFVIQRHALRPLSQRHAHGEKRKNSCCFDSWEFSARFVLSLSGQIIVVPYTTSTKLVAAKKPERRFSSLFSSHQAFKTVAATYPLLTVRERPFWMPFHTKTPNIYQDRLGTNILRIY
jgi:hypothetical protein